MTERIVLSLIIVIVTATPIAILDFPHHKKTETITREEIVIERTKATWKEKQANKKLAKEYAWAGWGWRGKQWECMNKLFIKEARYDHLAKNKQGSSAFGIGQRLKETSKDPTIQLLKTYRYVAKRYGTPCRAWSFHKRHNFY